MQLVLCEAKTEVVFIEGILSIGEVNMCGLIFKFGMQIEFDENKDEINIKKHRYSLSCAADILYSLLLMQPAKLIISNEFQTNGETRYKSMALYQDRIVFFIFTMRDDNMRLISFRDANENEEQEFWENIEQ